MNTNQTYISISFRDLTDGREDISIINDDVNYYMSIPYCKTKPISKSKYHRIERMLDGCESDNGKVILDSKLGYDEFMNKYYN